MTDETLSTGPKAGKNQFKCFHCRNICADKEGDWFDWDSMQVHMCKKCDLETRKSKERSHKNSR